MQTQTHQLPFTRSSIPRSASAIYAPILAHTLFLTIATVNTSPLTPVLLLLLVCEEQVRRTLRERMKRHPHVLPCKCQEWHTRRVLRVAEQWMGLF